MARADADRMVRDLEANSIKLTSLLTKLSNTHAREFGNEVIARY